MAFNAYVWNLYKNSPGGQAAIALFSEIDPEKLADAYMPTRAMSSEEVAGWVMDFHDFVVSPVLPERLVPKDGPAFFSRLVEAGIRMEFPDDEPFSLQAADGLTWLTFLEPLSIWLYDRFPDVFKPYFFKHQFRMLLNIADSFGISLPEVPARRNKIGRIQYYGQVCEAWSTFQQVCGMTAAECCAFLYDFAPAFLRQAVSPELPQPSQVWMVGGNKAGGDFSFLDDPQSNQTSFWQGNEETRRGDILVMYCLSPRSYIHSIWRAMTDGVADPFFYYYSNIYIGEGKIISPIHLNELKAHPVFSEHPLVRKNLHGVNGYPLTAGEYQELLLLLEKKATDTTQLPQLYRYATDAVLCANEREVEQKLLEPLLLQLGYKEEDWKRQLPLRMGRGERYFPDYAFLASTEKGFETAYMIIEAKYTINTNKKLVEAFKQAWSYAIRLQAKAIVIVDKEAIWVFDRQNEGFSRDRYWKKFWEELKQPDHLKTIARIIDKQALAKQSR
jgi:hypothetical protein